ncbi:DUF1524 domain-containing protein [Streptomyces sp. NPDC060027]|uniref:GmrSD restriction endonuclease domain-containing protein n=1 Tax=Streptomyces sp. NPDC060027 TaxID=3347040 RepID=UPI00369BFAB1
MDVLVVTVSPFRYLLCRDRNSRRIRAILFTTTYLSLGTLPTGSRFDVSTSYSFVTVVAQATIDHMVPLAEAWRSGADTWTADQRKAFGDYPKDPQLLITSESSNSSKSDSGPADWKPTNRAFWCT